MSEGRESSTLVAEKVVTDPFIRRGDLVGLQRRAVRLNKPPRRWRKPPYAEALDLKVEEMSITYLYMNDVHTQKVQIRGRVPVNSTRGMKSRFYGFDGQQCGVEELALQYYAREEGGGWQGMHSEGGMWMMLFSLLIKYSRTLQYLGHILIPYLLANILFFSTVLHPL